jgi:hypothetical protein
MEADSKNAAGRKKKLRKEGPELKLARFFD